MVEAIGTGAIATVNKAFQPTLERWVALKVLHYREAQSLARFRREAKAIALLQHRNIFMVYDYGEERNWPFIVMEYPAAARPAGAAQKRRFYPLQLSVYGILDCVAVICCRCCPRARCRF